MKLPLKDLLSHLVYTKSCMLTLFFFKKKIGALAYFFFCKKMAVFLSGRLVHLKMQHLLTYDICQGVLGWKHRNV